VYNSRSLAGDRQSSTRQVPGGPPSGDGPWQSVPARGAQVRRAPGFMCEYIRNRARRLPKCLGRLGVCPWTCWSSCGRPI